MKRGNDLLVGGTGFIGDHLALRLIKLGFKVFSLSRKKPKKKRQIKNLKYIYSDFINYSVLKKKIKNNFDYVINLGGNVNHREINKTYNSHYVAVKNLVKISKKKKVKRFIQVGSCLEYGKTKSPHKENVKPRKINKKLIYGYSKFKSTNYLLDEYKNNLFPAVIMRLYQVYGENQDLNRFIPIVIDACLKNKSFPCSEGKQKRDFIYIDDLVDAFIKIMLKKNNINGEIFNIGTGKAYQLKEIISHIMKICKGGRPLYGKIKLRPDESLTSYPLIGKAKKILKWYPKNNLYSGLKKTIRNHC